MWVWSNECGQVGVVEKVGQEEGARISPSAKMVTRFFPTDRSTQTQRHALLHDGRREPHLRLRTNVNTSRGTACRSPRRAPVGATAPRPCL
jgi:hypothetical protein